ncbi:MAG TPA: polyphenol oxidase family protein [Nannocystis sp.]
MIDRVPAFGGCVHGFTDRLGGVSEGRHASLNLGRRWGDDPAAVAENYRRVAAAAGFRVEDLRQVRQVHGKTVLRARDVTAASEADALWVHREDGPLVAGVLTADCVPILLTDVDGTVAAAVHSGWKGTVADIAGATVGVLAEHVAPARLLAAIGPCIEVEAFEVGEEVAVQFPAEHVRREGTRKPHVDLVATVRAQLIAAGVPAGAISRVGGCTFSDPTRYFSYRRDGAGIGQMLAFIGLG